MKIKKVTYTAAEINNFGATGTVKAAYIDVSLPDLNQPSGEEVVRKYPLSMSVVNGSGQGIEIALLSNAEEEADFLINPDEYFFLLPNNSSIGTQSRIGRMYKVAVRKESTNVSNPVRFDFLNHVGITKIN